MAEEITISKVIHTSELDENIDITTYVPESDVLIVEDSDDKFKPPIYKVGDGITSLSKLTSLNESTEYIFVGTKDDWTALEATGQIPDDPVIKYFIPEYVPSVTEECIHKNIDYSTWDDFSCFNFNNGRRDILKKLKFEDTSKGRKFIKFCRGATQLTDEDIADIDENGSPRFKFNTSKSETFEDFLRGCEQITTVHPFEASKSTSFDGAFMDCKNLKRPPEINTSSGVEFPYMFHNCVNLNMPEDGQPVEYNTANGENFSYMFDGCKFEKLPVTLSSTEKGINFYRTFSYCENLTEFPTVNTHNANRVDYMFRGTTKMEAEASLDLTNTTLCTGTFMGSGITAFDVVGTSNKVTDFNNMFSGCTKLTSVTDINFASCTSAEGMFTNCENLTELTFEDTSENKINTSFSLNGIKLPSTTLREVMNKRLSTQGTDKYFYLGQYNWDKVNTADVVSYGKEDFDSATNLDILSEDVISNQPVVSYNNKDVKAFKKAIGKWEVVIPDIDLGTDEDSPSVEIIFGLRNTDLHAKNPSATARKMRVTINPEIHHTSSVKTFYLKESEKFSAGATVYYKTTVILTNHKKKSYGSTKVLFETIDENGNQISNGLQALLRDIYVGKSSTTEDENLTLIEDTSTLDLTNYTCIKLSDTITHNENKYGHWDDSDSNEWHGSYYNITASTTDTYFILIPENRMWQYNDKLILSDGTIVSALSINETGYFNIPFNIENEGMYEIIVKQRLSSDYGSDNRTTHRTKLRIDSDKQTFYIGDQFITDSTLSEEYITNLSEGSTITSGNIYVELTEGDHSIQLIGSKKNAPAYIESIYIKKIENPNFNNSATPPTINDEFPATWIDYVRKFGWTTDRDY